MSQAAIDAVSLWPTTARAGDTVSIAVVLRNVGFTGGYLAPVVAVNGVVVGLAPDFVWVEPGSPGGFAGSFLMPNADALVEVWAYHWDGVQWVFDATASVLVPLIVDTPLPSSEFRDLESTFSMEAGFA